MSIYLTYDNESQLDGLGAQGLRIVGIYSLAKVFRLKYYHSPIKDIVEEFSHRFESDDSILKLIDRFNHLLEFPSFPLSKGMSTRYIHLKNPTLYELIKTIMCNLLRRENVVIRILFPFKILDKYVFMYTPGIKFLRANKNVLFDLSSEKLIVIHARFGYGWKYSNQKYSSKRRILPFSYYSKAIEKLLKAISDLDNYKLLIHTDLSKENILWSPADKRILNLAYEAHGILYSDTIPIEGYNLEELIEIPPYISSEIKYCAPFVETFQEMCNANILIMGTSALSYLAGLINQNLVIWPSAHGHGKRKCWLSSDRFGVPITHDEMWREGLFGI